MAADGLVIYGCKDARRNISVSSKPIMTLKDFEDFIFKPKYGIPIYLSPLQYPDKHGD